tara:strand:- start:8387 stop:8863 length:477 start_codon:yes stop_codon:yes gene_type:complete
MTFFFLLSSLLAGAAGALAMTYTMRVLSRLGGGDEVDMVLAIGSFFTGSKSHAFRTGTLIHLVSGVLFGLIYGLGFLAIGLIDLPRILFIGIGFGFIHGLIMAYCLMIYFAEKHPLEEFRSVSLVVGSVHLAGHLVFGATVGLIAGAASMMAQSFGLN